MHIGIIGGGFAGAACALHLMRDHPGLHAALTIIEPRAALGAGLAYSTPAPEHRTNVPAGRMSLLPDDPDNFHRWLQDRDVPARDPDCATPDGRLYAARALFGQYVDETLRAEVTRSRRVAFRHVSIRAQAVCPTGGRFDIRLEDGQAVHADAVVLAVSHSAPDVPSVLRCCRAVVADPWCMTAMAAIPAGARVVLVGTGLTACDVIASLLARGHHGQITAVSRHGLLPKPRTTLPVQAEGEFSVNPEAKASLLLRRVRKAVDTAVREGRPWENIIDALRQQAEAAWGALDWTERRRVLRHLRTYWDVHRFQCAPQIDCAVTRARASGAVQVRAAHLLAANEGTSGITLTVMPRHAEQPETIAADVVVNCTGSGHRSVTASHPVLRRLAERGGLQADPAELGIWVDQDSRVLRADGSAWPNLFVAGPLARGTFGELMGLPQVNTQPRQVAARLATMCRAWAPALELGLPG